MPGLNQQGPTGQGPMTGRKLGRCTNFGAAFKERETTLAGGHHETFLDDYPVRGYGRGHIMRGRGRGHGMGRMYRFRGEF